MWLGNQRTTIGNIRFISDGNTDGVNSNIIIVTAVISIAISILILVVILATVKCLKTRAHCCSSPSDKEKPFTNEAVNMYASPAYGTHQVFTEPGLDHLYERIDDEMTTTLQDTACGAGDEVDVDGYLKMRSHSEAVIEGGMGTSGTQQVAAISNPELVKPINEQLTQEREFHNVPLASDNMPQGDDPQETDAHNDDGSDYVIEKISKDATYLQVFHEAVDNDQFTGNITLV